MVKVLEKIELFLTGYCTIVTEEDLTKIYNLRTQVLDLSKKKLVENCHGSHYTDCPWSSSECECGPDTCRCTFNNIFTVEEKVDKIINFYKSIRSRVLANYKTESCHQKSYKQDDTTAK